MIANYFRFGWRRRALLYVSDYLPARLEERLLDFLYPDDLDVTFQ